MNLDRKWLTLGEAADVTGRSRRTIERWVADERLSALEVAGARYVNELQLLTVERATRRAHHGARPGTFGAIVLPRLDTDVVPSPQSRACSPSERS